MRPFPFLTLAQTLLLLRLATAFIFFAHAAVRVWNGSIEQFGDFLNTKGLIYGHLTVWGITAFEIVGSVLMALGYFVRVLSAGFIAMLLIGIVLIHASLGWFVGEHGTGGSEYSFLLIIALLVLAATEEKRQTQAISEAQPL
ncbi:DoxX family protein [Hymenobacter sp. BT730]|uniref:DoxX family protein n=1 Tax=Hymenobacter sp. BT730 TaxID=3063332 RepID=UPI0026E00B0F|nr:DoxX family protein [Hymenobacter sp. BT730]